MAYRIEFAPKAQRDFNALERFPGEFLDHDILGFWERYGYNNSADPFREERYSEE